MLPPPVLIDGHVYRTRFFRQWSANPTRLAARLVAAGELVRLRHGLYYRPRSSKWGQAPPDREELLRAALDDSPFLISGSSAWNRLSLGATAVFATPLVYNTKYTGLLEIAGQRFDMRRVRFPAKPSAEWFVVDLLHHRAMAGVDLETLTKALTSALRQGRFDGAALSRAATDYGTREVRDAVGRCLLHASESTDRHV